MGLYTVVLPAGAKGLLFDGVTDIVVEASTSALALTAAKAVSGADNDNIWDKATVTLLVQDLVGCVFTIGDNESSPLAVSYTALAEDTWADVGTALEVLCEVTYTSSWTPEATHGLVGTLLVATGSGTDDVGDAVLTVTATGPNGEDLTDLFFANIIDEGSTTDNLTVDILSTCPTLRTIGAYKA